MNPSPKSTVTHSRYFSHQVQRSCSCQAVIFASMWMSFRLLSVSGAERLCNAGLRECEDTRNDRASSKVRPR